MTLQAGTTVGHYQILGKLGEGGMGEVYRARDTRLGREVALKLLPESFTSDPERLARFEREARTLASLNHPNIAQIYGIEDPSTGSGRAALVMELVAGDDLSAMIARGPIAVPEALAIARQIADALEAAHEQGIVHRDLKPANVKVRADGTVKVLDFGLAKLTDAGGSGAEASAGSISNSPTLTAHGTQMGVILGTAAYMAPEQARGKAVDRRADIWAFGVVVFEMLTGRRTFEGEEISDVLAAVLRQDLDFTTLPSATPSSVRRLLKRCLERDPRKRLSAIGDARLDIDETDTPVVATPTPPGHPAGAAAARRPLLPLLIGVVLVGAAMFFAGRYLSPAGTGSGAAHVLALQQITDAADLESEPSLSPDGTSIAYTAGVGRHADVFVQRVGGRTSIAIAADPNVEEGSPAFSPDGATVAFHATSERGKGGIFVAGATGESARRLSEFGFHPSWSPDGQRLVFGTERIASPLARISTSELWIVEVKAGATPVKLFAGDAAQPAWSPNNKRIAFWRVGKGAQRDIATIPVAGGDPVAVTDDTDVDWGPKWSGDGRYLYFASDRGGAINIWRVEINEATGAALGPPEPVTQGVSSSRDVTVSRDGSRIAFTSASASTNPVAIPFDEAAEKLGMPKPLFDRTGFLSPTSASPDGQWIAYWNIGDRQEDIFISHADGSGFRRVTDDAFRDRFATWSPDSKELVFYSNRGSGYNIYAIHADGSGLRAVTERANPREPNGRADLLYPVFSPNGDRLVASGTRSDDTILIDPHKPWSSQTPEQLPMTVGPEGWIIPNQWSPDGARLLGPVVNASGGSGGVGVYDFATRKARLAASEPVSYFGFAWLPGSKRIVYQHEDNIMLVDVETGRRKEMPVGITLGMGLVVSRDGKMIYTTVRREQADIWMGVAK